MCTRCFWKAWQRATRQSESLLTCGGFTKSIAVALQKLDTDRWGQEKSPEAQSEVGLERTDNSPRWKLLANLQGIRLPRFRKVATDMRGVRTSPGDLSYSVRGELFQSYPQIFKSSCKLNLTEDITTPSSADQLGRSVCNGNPAEKTVHIYEAQ